MRRNDRLAEFDRNKDEFEERRWQEEMKKAITKRDLSQIKKLLERADINDYSLSPFSVYANLFSVASKF